MRPTIAPFALALLILSCVASAQESIYALPFANQKKLPPCEVIIDYDKTAQSYPGNGQIIAYEETGEGDITEQNVSFHNSSKLLVDALRFLEYYAMEELTESDNVFTGLIELSVVYYDTKNRFNAGSLIDLLSFGFGALFGIPHSTLVTWIEVEARVFDTDGNFKGSFRGFGKSKRLESIYNSPARTGNQKAMVRALETLNQKIMADPLLSQL